MKDHQIRAWLRVVDTGSIRGAARSLNLTQAAVTKAIRELEDELDAPLLVRSSRGITPTEFGVRLTTRLRLAMSQFTLARQDIHQLRGGGEAQVGVAVTPTVFLTVLPEVIRDFKRLMPLANLSVVEGLMNAVLPALRQGSVDFAIAAPSIELLPSDLVLEPLHTLEMVVVCRRGHPLADSTSWDRLSQSEWLMHPSDEQQKRQLFRWLSDRGLPIPTRITSVNTFGVTWSLLTHTDALFVCPKAMLSVPLYGEQVTRVPLKVSLPSLTLGIVALKESPLSFAAEELARLFRRAYHPSRRATMNETRAA